ncbi:MULTISPECIES: ATP-binding protein [Kitasatospora]|uniref:SCO6881 family protein n=1 Tax=Kitasatospora sp. NPDC017646 TaxID=3364024 RepID=UPI0033D13AFB
MAKSAADLAAKAVDTTTKVDLGASWFRDNYSLILPIGLVVIVATFCLQLMRAAWRRDGQALSQAVTGTVSGVLFSFVAVSCTSIALTIVDALSEGLFHVANTSTSDAVARVIRVGQITTLSDLGWGIPALVALGCVAGAIMYWGTMVLRKVAILVLVTLAVFAGAGGGWEPASRWRRAWIEATAALVVSKLVMTIIFLLGVSAIGRSDGKGGALAALSDVLAGIVVMIMVLLAPMMTYKFLHWASDGTGADLHRTTSTGLATAAGAARKGATMAMSASTGGAGGAAMAGAPQGPATVPGQNSPVGGSPSSPSAAPSGPSGPAQSTFAFPGTGKGGSVDAVTKPLITRRGSGGGQPLITRAASEGGGDSAPTSAPSPATAAEAAAPPGGSGAAAPAPIVLGAPRTGSRASSGPAGTFMPSTSPAGPAVSSAPVSGPAPAPAPASPPPPPLA